MPRETHDGLARIRATCLGFPGAYEALAWGESTFRVRGKLFAMYASPATHHGRGRPAVWIAAAPANQTLLVRHDPARYFVPPYVGVRGWVGAWLDFPPAGRHNDAPDEHRPDWARLTDLLRDAYCRVAPKRLSESL